jgi:membrane protease YdiL (CAAX protease family)
MTEELRRRGQGGVGGWRGIAAFLAIAYGLSWAAQVGLAVAVHSAVNPDALGGGGFLAVAAALMWPPAVAAFVVRRWLEGGSFADAGLRRGPGRYLLLGWLLPPLLVLGALVLSLPIFPLDPELSTLQSMLAGAGVDAPAGVVLVGQIVAGLTVGTAFNCPFAFGEEFGWRGYLLPRLIERLGPRRGLLAHGAVWGFWHAPLIALAG